MLHDHKYAESVISRLECSGPEGKVYAIIGRQILQILGGQVDVLDLLFGSGLLQQFYSGSVFTASYAKMRAYVELLAHKNPSMRVLEIGAGTGGATESVLIALGPPSPNDGHCTARFHEYDYTDVSASFFERAKARFERYSDRMDFKALDIEKDIKQQGFEEGKYDLIVASCVLHATTNIHNTLTNTRALLKPGGKLLLLEPCQLDSARLSFVFGLLPGWWLSTEEDRYWSPLLSEYQWNEALRRAGFSGNDVCLPDMEGEIHTFTVIVSTKVETIPNTPATDSGVIVIEPRSELQTSIARGIQRFVETAGSPIPEISSLHEAAQKNHLAYCISLVELEHPFLICMDATQLSHMKQLVKSFKCILWATPDETESPLSGASTGFGRSMCSENDTLDFVCVALQDLTSTHGIARKLFTILRASLNAPEGHCEQEYREENGQLFINRIAEVNTLNDFIYTRTVPQGPIPQPFGEQSNRPLTLKTASPGLLSSLQFVDNPYELELGPDEIEVEVKAVGINFKNVMAALGQVPDTSLGKECSGIITSLGSAVAPTEFKIGDRVCCLSHDGFRNYTRSDQSLVYRIPDDMSFATAAAVPVAFSTAYYSLIYLARLMPGESVLIHAGAGGVGQAAIQIAQTKTSNIYVTVSSEKKKSLLVGLYGIPPENIFSSRHTSFAQGIRRITDGRGVDVVLNSLSGELLKESVRCVAPLGRFVEIGKKDIYQRSNLSMAAFSQGIAFFAVDLGIIAAEAKPLMREILKTSMDMFRGQNHHMKTPHPLTVFRGGQVEDAFRMLQSGRSSGKVVIEFSAEDVIPVSSHFISCLVICP
jgi:NADPH:quinone reductase-like Zn-dependent oxidoreductase/SAM-dependent methyltransferase